MQRRSSQVLNRSPLDAFGDQEGEWGAGAPSGEDALDSARGGASGGLWGDVIVGDGWNQILKPSLMTEGDDGEFIRKAESFGSEPRNEGEDMAGG